VTLRLFDSAARQVRDFVPLVEGRVGIYVCGATPQASPHIGHVRAQVNYDVLRRWLVRKGTEVVLVRNVTDIDDKILTKSAEAKTPWWAHAFAHEQEFTAAYQALNVLPPTYEPRATGHIVEMLDLVRRLVEGGHAYPAEDGSGDVYFDVRSFPEYGALTRQSIDDMEVAADADPRAKRDPHDFALWKGHKPTEPETASWPSPWGRGRPGWHLECSAMATRYLGAEFDIHGGGLDLRFPHHENEQAQSRAAGDPFARYWLHNALVVIGGEKMSKSLGNSLAISVLLGQIRPVALRYLLVAAHYRSNIEIGAGDTRATRLAEAEAAYGRIESFVTRAVAAAGDRVRQADPAGAELPPAFVAAMDDDLGTSAALAVLHENVRLGNTALAEQDGQAVVEHAVAVRAMADVLGLDPLDPHWDDTAGAVGGTQRDAALDALIRAELAERAAARERRDWASADAIRDRLADAGVTVEDTPDGARWTLEGGAR
jgi:cysteinyl-tRNA synthetase